MSTQSNHKVAIETADFIDNAKRSLTGLKSTAFYRLLQSKLALLDRDVTEPSHAQLLTAKNTPLLHIVVKQGGFSLSEWPLGKECLVKIRHGDETIFAVRPADTQKAATPDLIARMWPIPAYSTQQGPVLTIQ